MKIQKNDAITSGVNHKTGKRRDTRLQQQIRFNLNLRRPDESSLADDIAALRKLRQFRPTILNALRLFLDLKDGYLDVLQELFPDAVQRIQAAYQNAEIEALRREIAELRSQGFSASMQAQQPPAIAPAVGKMTLVKGITANTGKAFANSIGGYFD